MGQVRKFKVYLEPEQRKRLEAIAHNGHAPVKKIVHAQILLMADQEHPQGRWKDEQIVRVLGVHRNTISRIRRRFVEQGEEPALNRRARAEPPTPPKLDGEKEAQLVAILKLAAARRPSPLEFESLGGGVERPPNSDLDLPGNRPSHVKKNVLKPWKKKRYCIPERDAARFVAQMEAIFGPLYRRTQR
jgi:hypothetical protein